MASEPIHEDKPEEGLSVKLGTEKGVNCLLSAEFGIRLHTKEFQKLEGNICQYKHIAMTCIMGSRKGLSNSMISRSPIKPRISSFSHGQTQIVRTVR